MDKSGRSSNSLVNLHLPSIPGPACLVWSLHLHSCWGTKGTSIPPHPTTLLISWLPWSPPVWYHNIVTTNDTLLLLLQILHLSLSSTILGWFKSSPRLLLSSCLHSLFHPALSLQVWYSNCKCPFKCYPECSNHITQLFCLIPNIPFTSNKGFLSPLNQSFPLFSHQACWQ